MHIAGFLVTDITAIRNMITTTPGALGLDVCVGSVLAGTIFQTADGPHIIGMNEVFDATGEDDAVYGQTSCVWRTWALKDKPDEAVDVERALGELAAAIAEDAGALSRLGLGPAPRRRSTLDFS